jgi:hypothetical protein
MLALADFVQMVVVTFSHLALIVCVKLVDCLATVNVWAVPSVPLPTFNVDFRGIVVSVLDAEAVIVPLLTPVTNDAEQLNVFEPFELWLTLTVFVITV